MVFFISIGQSISSQSVTISGTTGAGSSHTHGRGTWDIKGTFTSGGYESKCVHTGAFYKTSTTSDKLQGGDYARTVLGFQASKNWTGTLGSESSHTHSFSSSATIGSGNYTRPNSTSTLIIIKY